MLPDILTQGAIYRVTFCMQATQPAADLFIVGCAVGSALCTGAPAIMGGVCDAVWRSVTRR